MIQPLTIAEQTFPVNLVQGPLAGVSAAPFRRLVWRYSQPAFTYTEMISCKTLLYQNDSSLIRFTKIDPEEGPVCFQLSANHPTELAEATKKVTQLGASLIDLNCGCPVKKIRSKGAGSRLLSDASKLYQLITAMKQHTHLPVSIKIRVDGGSDEQFNHEIAKVVADAGTDFLVVHGRHWSENYDVPCRYDEIRFFVDSLSIPVLGNGDIANLSSLQQMLATGCAGAMIGRAGVGQPWLIAQLIAEWQQQAFDQPTLPERGSMFVDHIADLATLLGGEKFALLVARKLAKYYGRELLGRNDFCGAVNGVADLTALASVVADFFGANKGSLAGNR